MSCVHGELDNLSLLATVSQDQTVDEIDDAIGAINALPTDVFKNKNMSRTLTNKLLVVIELDEYNTVRLHGSLGGMTPEIFLHRWAEANFDQQSKSLTG